MSSRTDHCSVVTGHGHGDEANGNGTGLGYAENESVIPVRR